MVSIGALKEDSSFEWVSSFKKINTMNIGALR
jgi:hypothetical protein